MGANAAFKWRSNPGKKRFKHYTNRQKNGDRLLNHRFSVVEIGD
jgi:hypothetical protein